MAELKYQKTTDKEHPYGHDVWMCGFYYSRCIGCKYEPDWHSGINKIYSGQYNTLSVPGRIALTAVLSIVYKEDALLWGAAKHTNSDALMADAWHHRSDALSSVGSLIGILGARLGYAILDPIARCDLRLYLKAAGNICINKMVDHSCDNITETKIRELVLQQQGLRVLTI